MTPRTRVDGRPDAAVAADNRGLLYGDGLFETLRVVRGTAPLWSRHMQRLAAGCERLGLPLPDEGELYDDVAALSPGIGAAVARITWTRGSGPRGYRPPLDARGVRMVTLAPAPPVHPDWSEAGIRVRFCQTRLATQPALAGLKHLNRLEQVLARAEWDDPAIAEGLMLDLGGHVVCATAANLFARIGGAWCTPAVDACGVAGVARAEVLGQWPGTRVTTIDMDTLMQAEEVFLSSSVRGIVPVREIGARRFDVGASTRAMQAHFHALLELDA